MFMADGGSLLGTRLTPDLIPLIAWNEDLAANAMSISAGSHYQYGDGPEARQFKYAKSRRRR